MPEFLINLGTVFLGSGAALALFNWHIEHRREKRTRADETEFLAIQLAIEFEGFAIQCAARVSDHMLANNSDGTAGQQITSLPDAPRPPTSDAYKYFDRKLLDDILRFPQDCLLAGREAEFSWLLDADRDSSAETYKDHAISLGVNASGLAKEIRTKNQLPDRNLTFGRWGIDEFLREEMSKIFKRGAT